MPIASEDGNSCEVPNARSTIGAPQHWVALALLAFTLYQSFLTTGIVYGWPAFLLILRREGIYASLCRADEQGDCLARTVALNLIFTLAVTLGNILGIFNGRIVDLLGPKRAIGAGVFMIGVASVCIAVAAADDSFIWPVAYTMYIIAGGAVHTSSMSLANAFAKSKGLVISCMVAMYSLSSMTFQIMLSALESGELTRRDVFLGHATIEVMNLMVSIWFWPSRPLNLNEGLRLHKCTVKIASPKESHSSPADIATQQDSIKNEIVSAKFVIFALFHAVQFWVNRCLMGWVRPLVVWKDTQIQSFGGASIDKDMHMSVFNACQSFAGLTVIPIFGFIIAKCGHRLAPFVVTNILLVITIVLLYLPSEWSLLAGYALGGIHRQFFFSTFFNFLVSEFPSKYFSTLGGIGNVLAGVLAYTQNSILSMILGSFGSDFSIPLLAFLGIAISLFPLILAEYFRTHFRHNAGLGNDVDQDKKSCCPDVAIITETTDLQKNDAAGCADIALVPETHEEAIMSL